MRGDNEDSEQSVHNKTERGGPLNNAGKQSDSNVRRTLGHVEPTMGGVVTLVNKTPSRTLSRGCQTLESRSYQQSLSRSSPHKTYCMATKRRRNWAWPDW